MMLYFSSNLNVKEAVEWYGTVWVCISIHAWPNL